MANEKVSQMTPLAAGEVAGEDLFLITDVSLHESKKISVSSFLTYIELTASINADSAVNSDTASYILGSNVDGLVSSASYSLKSLTSSYSDKSINSDTASLARTASYVNISDVSVATASYLRYTGINNGTASYSLTSSYVDTSNTASVLLYIPGLSANTASYSLTSSISLSSSYSTQSYLSETSSYSITSSFSETSSYSQLSFQSQTASYLSNAFNPIKAWGWVTWSLGVQYPRLYKSYNINSIKYLNTFTYTTSTPDYVWAQFGVEFINPVSDTDYILMGDGYQPYQVPERAGVVMHPIYSNRTVNSFTMSIVTEDDDAFYTEVSGAYPNSNLGYVAFQIIG